MYAIILRGKFVSDFETIEEAREELYRINSRYKRVSGAYIVGREVGIKPESNAVKEGYTPVETAPKLISKVVEIRRPISGEFLGYRTKIAVNNLAGYDRLGNSIASFAPKYLVSESSDYSKISQLLNY